MTKLGTIGKILKYLGICLLLLSPSLLLAGRVFAADTGGYPWADAEVVDSSTYDWGYRQCPPAVQQAGNCSVHTRYKWGVKYHLSDPWRYDLRNCTSYVAWRVNRDFGISIPGWGNAGNWDNAAAGRFEVNTTPKAGSIAVWNGLYGHVAFVTKVYPNGMFEVDQYNNAGTGKFSHQLRASADHFIHVQPAKAVKTIKTARAKQAKPPVRATAKPIVAKPVPPSIEGALVPKPAIGDITPSSPLPSTREVEYLLEYSPKTEQINAYAIRHTHTKSGKIEINQSSMTDKNTKFQKTKVSAASVRGEGQTKFALADYNQDKILDLYVIKVNATKSNKQEILVLDGASDYQKQLLKSVSNLAYQDADNVSYKVADQNNDRRQDIYKITNPNAEHKTRFEVLDGAKNYTSTLNHWSSKSDIPYDSSTNFYIGDHDGDGRVDIYHSFQNKANKGRFSVDIYEAKQSLEVATRQLIVGDPTSSPDIVLPLIKIKDEAEQTPITD